MIRGTPVSCGRSVEDMEDWKILAVERPVERHERIIPNIYPVDDLDDSGMEHPVERHGSHIKSAKVVYVPSP